MKSRLALLAACGALAIACAALGQPSAYRGAGDPAKATDLPSARLYIPPQGITFKATDFISANVRLTAQWFYATPNEGKKLPTVIMAHGWGATAASFREDAIDLAKAGYLVMVFDYRGWGESDGRVMLTGRPPAAGKTGAAQVRELRGYFDPLEQHDDWLNAVNYAVTYPMVDADHIGIRGTSESGGQVLSIAVEDHRVKALVSQVTAADLRPLAPAAVAEANAAA
ncbi:MAG: alpha/beta fold hydrolase, partial [Alphaproteobacteria bacterium]